MLVRLRYIRWCFLNVSIMKKFFAIVIPFMLLAVLPVAAQGRCGCRDCRDCCDDCRHYRVPQYYVNDNGVFFDGRRVEGASPSGFAVLGDGYAKDAWAVYYFGNKINFASAESFQVSGYGYARDAWNVYFDGVKIDGAMADSFSCGPDGYRMIPGIHIITDVKSSNVR